MPEASDIKYCLSFEKPTKWSLQRGNIWQYYGGLVAAATADIYDPIDMFLHYSMLTAQWMEALFFLCLQPWQTIKFLAVAGRVCVTHCNLDDRPFRQSQGRISDCKFTAALLVWCSLCAVGLLLRTFCSGGSRSQGGLSYLAVQLLCSVHMRRHASGST